MDNLDLNQLQEAFNSNEELRGQLLETIANSDAGKQYLNNYATNHFEQNIGTKIGEVHGAYDKDFEEVLGVKKPDGVKSYVFWKDEVAKLKDLASSADPKTLEELKSKNEQLQSMIDNNEQAKYLKDELDSFKKQYSSEIEEKNRVIEEFNNKQRMFTIQGELNKALSNMNFNETLPEDVRNTYISNVTEKLLADAKILEDGSIAFYDGGELITNKKTMSKATASEILANSLKSIIASKADTTGGGGQEPGVAKRPSNVTFSNAKSKLELQSLVESSLLADGLRKGTSEFTTKQDELLAEYGKDLPLR